VPTCTNNFVSEDDIHMKSGVFWLSHTPRISVSPIGFVASHPLAAAHKDCCWRDAFFSAGMIPLIILSTPWLDPPKPSPCIKLDEFCEVKQLYSRPLKFQIMGESTVRSLVANTDSMCLRDNEITRFLYLQKSPSLLPPSRVPAQSQHRLQPVNGS